MQRGFEFHLVIIPKEFKIISWCECIFYFKLALKSSHNNQSLLLSKGYLISLKLYHITVPT
jgi:hypothetical protein